MRMSGSTENASSASHHFMRSITKTIPARTKTSSKIAKTPEVNISLSASTSLVSRVTSRPDRIAVVEADVHALQVAEDLPPHVEHDLLARSTASGRSE